MPGANAPLVNTAIPDQKRTRITKSETRRGIIPRQGKRCITRIRQELSIDLDGRRKRSPNPSASHVVGSMKGSGRVIENGRGVIPLASPPRRPIKSHAYERLGERKKIKEKATMEITYMV